MDDILKQNIINDLGLDDLSKEKQEEVLNKITESLLKRIMVESFDKLTEEEIAEFENKQETATPEEITAFFKSKIDNYDQFIQEIVTTFRAEMREHVEILEK